MELTKLSDVGHNRGEAPSWPKLFGKTLYLPRAIRSKWLREISISLPRPFSANILKRATASRTVRGRGGSYYTVVVDGDEKPDAARYYPGPKTAAENILGYIAFWHGVEVSR